MENDRSSWALLTDLYQLTMAQGYFLLGKGDRRAAFHLFFRKAPFAGQLALVAGLEPALQFLETFRFSAEDVTYLAQVPGNDGQPLFQASFLDFLSSLRLQVDVDAMPEGTVAFAGEPLLRVQGPLLQCQLLETALLNIVNFQTLIATKAARICHAAGADPVLEFGLRRAQGVDGALAASRAAYLGGCAATSNVLAGKQFGIPVRGTHAHSWVMSFDSEWEALSGYARAMPNNCVFLVDTYDTLKGVRCAIEVGQALRERGHEMIGVRLDSGDLAELSRRTRSLLDAAGFADAQIVASNDLDEQQIAALKERGATIGVWGVGTRLVTGGSQAALGGVYKLGALQDASGAWKPTVKLSEDPLKVSTPGVLQVRRHVAADGPPRDMIWNELAPPPPRARAIDPRHPENPRPLEGDGEELLLPVLRDGSRVQDLPPLGASRARARREWERFVPFASRGTDIFVGLEAGLFDLKAKLVQGANK